jgi:poly(A) polymerase
VHVFFSGENIEVSTFRANIGAFKSDNPEEDMLQNDNVYGTIEEDAWRRDFTVNALYYHVEEGKVLDFLGGLEDLKTGIIRMIGDPVQRYHEDPVRMLRAVRLAAKLEFQIEEKTAEPIGPLLHLLAHVPGARFFDEILKLFFEGFAESTYVALKKYQLFPAIFPETDKILKADSSSNENLILLALRSTDQRFHAGKSLNPGFLLSVFLWPVFEANLQKFLKQKKRFFHALDLAITFVIEEQCETLKMPKRLTSMIRSIWLLQFYLEKRRPNRIQRVLSDRYFRAAYDFLELRVMNGEKLLPIFHWWKKIRSLNAEEQLKMIAELK